MARSIILTLNEEPTTFLLHKLTREQLYGKRDRLVLDPQGQLCERAELTADGATIVRPGMIASGYFSEAGHQISRRELVGLDAEGKALPRLASTLNEAQSLHEAAPTELLDLAVSATYTLSPSTLGPDLASALADGRIFRCDFNYKAGFHLRTAFLVGNDEGAFLLVGDLTKPFWSGFEAHSGEELLDPDDGLDFGMF